MIHDVFISYVPDLRNKHGGNRAHVRVMLVESGMCHENHRTEIGLKVSFPLMALTRSMEVDGEERALSFKIPKCKEYRRLSRVLLNKNIKGQYYQYRNGRITYSGYRSHVMALCAQNIIESR